MILLLFVVFLGRVTEAQAVISDAAHQAARAASIAQSPAAATAQARQAAGTALSGRGLACQHFTVSVGLGGFRPGGTVRATVTCTTGLSDLALPGGSRQPDPVRLVHQRDRHLPQHRPRVQQS